MLNDPCLPQAENGLSHTSAYVSIRQHTSACVSIRQHASAYISIRQHTSAHVSTYHIYLMLNDPGLREAAEGLSHAVLLHAAPPQPAPPPPHAAAAVHMLY